ncbi:unnamed protein product [Prorocentrum cordatum]|uniref:Uncharacterized protein n=1 Tax=Prorocentrum cordatum TaxID=2364126 RepID=A0ABN9QMS7_9DINO|nr:unnamed protein product [Polarella glacialis]
MASLPRSFATGTGADLFGLEPSSRLGAGPIGARGRPRRGFMASTPAGAPGRGGDPDFDENAADFDTEEGTYLYGTDIKDRIVAGQKSKISHMSCMEGAAGRPARGKAAAGRAAVDEGAGHATAGHGGPRAFARVAALAAAAISRAESPPPPPAAPASGQGLCVLGAGRLSRQNTGAEAAWWDALRRTWAAEATLVQENARLLSVDIQRPADLEAGASGLAVSAAWALRGAGLEGACAWTLVLWLPLLLNLGRLASRLADLADLEPMALALVPHEPAGGGGGAPPFCVLSRGLVESAGQRRAQS